MCLWRVLAGVWLAWGLAAAVPRAQEPVELPGAVDRFSAAFAAQEKHDREAVETTNAQIDLQEYIRWQSGLPDRRLYFADQPGPQAFDGGMGPLALRRGGPLWWWQDDGVFEPWPVAPGDIYGFRYDHPIEQPAGSRMVWTSPNSYVYGPVYDRRPAAPVLPGLGPPRERSCVPWVSLVTRPRSGAWRGSSSAGQPAGRRLKGH